MATTFTKIASVSVGVLGASSIDFTSIPSTYTDLVMLTSLRTNAAANTDAVRIRLNGDSGNNYSIRYVFGDGNAANSGASSGISFGVGAYASAATATSSTFGNTSCYIPNYGSSSQKSFSTDSVAENNATGSQSAVDRLEANLWTGTAAINAINLTPNTGTLFNQYSTATLYGISKS